MQPPHRPADRRRVRSIFLSDVHLGSRYSHAAELLDFLEACDPEYVYIVGDFIDGWSLSRAWRWRASYSRILDLLFAWARQGVTICYAPGNHDAFLRDFLTDFGLFQVADQFVHRGPGGQRYLVTHGDQLDTVELRARWLSLIGGLAYDLLMWTNHTWNTVRRWFGCQPTRFSTRIKFRIKKVVSELSLFEQRWADYARARQCDAVVCGHIHVPKISRRGSVTYCNTGDWVENCTALLEDLDGTLRLEQYQSSSGGRNFRQLQTATVGSAAAGRIAEPAVSRHVAAPCRGKPVTTDWQPAPLPGDRTDDGLQPLAGSAARSRSSV
jgi:UDP-2,3-diacylglucosamine pyrophosphatase LpxH